MYVSRKCFDQNGPDVTPKIVIKSKTKGLTRNVFARKLISETMFICYYIYTSKVDGNVHQIFNVR